jgi:hypothetical protein
LFSRHLGSQTLDSQDVDVTTLRVLSLQCPYLFAANCELIIQLLGSLAELLKATVSFVISCLSVCLSAHLSFRTEQLGSQKTDFHSI